MTQKDGAHEASIPQEFITRGSISVHEAIAESSINDVAGLCLSQTTMTGSRFLGEVPQDLKILQALARWDINHGEFLDLMRINYEVEVNMSWDDELPPFQQFIKLRTHPLFGLFLPELLCKIEDHDMYKFTSFGRLEPPNAPHFLLDALQPVQRMQQVEDLVQSSPRLTIVRFVDFLNAVLKAASDCGDMAVSFSLLWNLYKRKHKKRKQSASQQNVLIQFLIRHPQASAYLSRGKEIWITAESRPHQKNMIPILHNSRTRMAQFKRSQHYKDYKQYLSTFVNSITHAKCASKFTRVSTLHSKPLTFTFQRTEQSEFETYFKLFTKKFHLSDRSKYSFTEQDVSNARRRIDAMQKDLDKQLLEHYSARKTSAEKTGKIASIRAKKESSQRLSQMLSMYARQKNEPTSLEATTFQQWHHTSTAGVVPLVINGGAGMGKTIRLTQFALSYASDLVKMHEVAGESTRAAHPFPVFLKAKRCFSREITNLRRHGSPTDQNNIVSTLKEMMVASNPSLLNHLTKGELKDAVRGWLIDEHAHRSGFVFFIDGLDECPTEQDASELMSWFTNLGTPQPPTIILSTRPSHYGIAANILGAHGRVNMLADEGYYTKQELSHDIPMRLCDAWGMTRHSARALANVFSDYESILQHPLFVGWFCFLILNGEVDGLNQRVQDPEIARNNLISKIIDIGIESSLKRREAEFSGSVDDPASDEFLRVLRMFVAVAFHFDLARPEHIYDHMKLYNLVDSISPSIQESIEKDCGILFLTGEHVEWTHRTIPELMYADFHSQHPETHLWGPLKATSPVVNRLAQLTFERGDTCSYLEAMILLNFKYDREKFESQIFEAWSDLGNRHLIGLDSRHNLTPIRDGNQPHEIRIAELYIKNLDSNASFPLFYDFLEQKNNREIAQKILEYSHDPFGRDLLLPDDGQPCIHIDDVRTELVLNTTKISDCFEYYRDFLANLHQTPNSVLDLNHEVFSIHKRARNPEHLFLIGGITGWSQHMVLESGIADTWLAPWLADQQSSRDAEFYTNERMELIKFITEAYVESAYTALFGGERWADLLNTVYEHSHRAEINVVVGSGEFVDVERRNLLNHWMWIQNLNDLVSVDSIHRSPANILNRYDTGSIYVRGIVLMPFVTECLRYIEGNKNVDFEEFLEHQPDFLPFHIISNHASRIIKADNPN